MAQSRLVKWSPGVVALLGGIAFLLMVAPATLAYSRTHDFLNFYAGGLLARTDPAHLFDPGVQSKLQFQLAPAIPIFTPFCRPAVWALGYLPLSYLSLDNAFAVWIALDLVVTLLLYAWLARRFGPDVLVYCAFFLPLLYGIIHGQDTVFVAALTVLAYLAAERGRKTLCGVLLAMLLIKFHLFLLIPVMLLYRREWRMLAGYAPAAFIQIAVSVAIASPRSYIDLLMNRDLEALHPSPHMMVNLNAICANFGIQSPVVLAVLTSAVLAALFLIPRNAPLDRWLWATVAAGLLITPHTFEYDVAFLIFPIMKTVMDPALARPLRWIAATAAIPIPYFMTLLPKPYSAAPALLIGLLFLSFAWPEWFDRRLAAARPEQPAVA